MIISEAKPLAELQEALAPFGKLFLVGCAACATACKAGGEEELFRFQEWLAGEGKETTGSVVIDEACHLMRAARDLRHHAAAVAAADALVVLACGSGVQSISSNTDKRVIGALNSLFLDNVHITKYIPDAPRTRAEAKEELEWHMHGHPRNPNLGLWGTIHKETGKFIGRCGLIPWNIDWQEEVEVAYSGGELEIGFNVNYLMDALAAIEGPEVQIGLTDGNSSCLIRSAADAGSKFVVMPMRL